MFTLQSAPSRSFKVSLFKDKIIISVLIRSFSRILGLLLYQLNTIDEFLSLYLTMTCTYHKVVPMAYKMIEPQVSGTASFIKTYRNPVYKFSVWFYEMNDIRNHCIVKTIYYYIYLLSMTL